jgi:hypothetical protein
MKPRCLAIALVATALFVFQACGGDDDDGKGGTGGTAGTGATGGSAGNTDAGEQTDSGPGFDAGSDPNRNKVQPGQICDRFATIQCAGEAYCCDNADRDFTECKQVMKDACTGQLAIDAVAANQIIGFDSAVAEKAFAEFESKASKCDTSVAAWGTSMEGMRGILKGTVDTGQSCFPSDAKNTEATIAALASCKDGAKYACLPISETVFTCSKRSDAGGPCYTDINCADGLYCKNSNMDLIGSVCAARKSIGESCVQTNECESLYCKKGKCVAADQQTVYCL